MTSEHTLEISLVLVCGMDGFGERDQKIGDLWEVTAITQVCDEKGLD